MGKALILTFALLAGLWAQASGAHENDTPSDCRSPGALTETRQRAPPPRNPGLTQPAQGATAPCMEKEKKQQQVYTLVVEVGRKTGDGLPKGATGAGLMIYASGVDEAEAVRETVAILKQADLSPLDVQGYGTLDERREMGHEISDDEIALMQRAADENSVIVAQMTPYFGDKSA